MLEVESRFSVEENAACSCFSRDGRLEALQLGFTPTSRSGDTSSTDAIRQGAGKYRRVEENIII